MPENQVGKKALHKNQTFVMTERKAHHAWAKLILDNPTAARLIHIMVAQMGPQNALVVSQKTLAKLMKCHVRTIVRAINSLVADNWIQRVRLGGTVHGYIINDQIAWCEKQVMKQYSAFSAAVVVDQEDQAEEDLKPRELRKLPLIYPPDEAILLQGDPPHGSQSHLPGMEPVVEGNKEIGFNSEGDIDLDQMDLNGETKRERMLKDD